MLKLYGVHSFNGAFRRDEYVSTGRVRKQGLASPMALGGIVRLGFAYKGREVIYQTRRRSADCAVYSDTVSPCSRVDRYINM